MMGFVVREKAVENYGPLETEALVTAIRKKLKERLGGRLGGPAERPFWRPASGAADTA